MGVAAFNADEIVARMDLIRGWFSESEARLVIDCVAASLRDHPEAALVEVGSYLGRSTVAIASVAQAFGATVYAIDPHDGDLGLDVSFATGPTLARFVENVARAGVADSVEVLQNRSYEVEWDQSIGFLLIDGQHDYENVSRDYGHFAPYLVEGAIVVFHDYGSNPTMWGVTTLVDELVRDGLEWLARAGCAAALRRT